MYVLCCFIFLAKINILKRFLLINIRHINSRQGYLIQTVKRLLTQYNAFKGVVNSVFVHDDAYIHACFLEVICRLTSFVSK